MDDPFLEQSELLLSAAGVDDSFKQCAEATDAEYTISDIEASTIFSAKTAGSLRDDFGVINLEGSDDSIQIFAINAEPFAAAVLLIKTESETACMSTLVIEDSLMKSSHDTSAKCGTKSDLEELYGIISSVGVEDGDHLDNNLLLTRAEFLNVTGDAQRTSKVGALTIDIPSTTKSSPITSISDIKPASAELQLLSLPSSQKAKKKGDELANIKCSVIRGSSLISTSIDIRHHLKVGSSVTIDGLQYQTANNATDWTSSHIALQFDWPGDSNFESTLTIISPTHNGKKSPLKKKKSVISVEDEIIQNVSNESDDFLISKSAANSNNNSIIKNKMLTKIVGESRILGNSDKVNSPNKILKKSEQLGNFDDKKIFDVKTSSSPIKDKMNSNEAAIESSRLLALNRVTGKIREEREQTKIDNENKIQNTLLAQIIAEKKAAELHIKSLERITLRKDVERANKHRLLCLEEEQRAYEEISNSKLDERILKMDEMKKKTLERYVREYIILTFVILVLNNHD